MVSIVRTSAPMDGPAKRGGLPRPRCRARNRTQTPECFIRLPGRRPLLSISFSVPLKKRAISLRITAKFPNLSARNNFPATPPQAPAASCGKR